MICPFAKIECVHCKQEEKKPYGENGKVFLTDKELETLVKRLTHDGTMELIDRLNDYIMQIGDRAAAKYKSHAATIRNWSRRDNGGKFKPKADTLYDKMVNHAKEKKKMADMDDELRKYSYEWMKMRKMTWPVFIHNIENNISMETVIDYKSMAAGE